MHNIIFTYKDKFSDAAFHIGPINFTLNAGDLLFITGGNGSGKSRSEIKSTRKVYRLINGEAIRFVYAIVIHVPFYFCESESSRIGTNFCRIEVENTRYWKISE